MKPQIATDIQQGVHISYFDLPGSDAATSPLVMLHGLGASASSTWSLVVDDPRLRNHRRLLIDLPGFGDSTAPANWRATIDDHANIVADLLDRLELRAVAVIGHSMGGSIAICLATIRPDLVDTLIVAEPNLDPNTGTFSGQITRFTERTFIDRGRFAILRSLRFDEQRHPHLRDIRFAESVAAASPILLHRSAVSLRSDREPTFRELLYALPNSSLFIAGDDCIESVRDDLPQHEIALAMIAGAGHVMMRDDPDEFVRIINEFLLWRASGEESATSAGRRRLWYRDRT